MKKKKETIGFGYYNTELCVDLKTILLNDPVMKMNMAYSGTLVKDGEEHFLFKSDAWMQKAVDKVLSCDDDVTSKPYDLTTSEPAILTTSKPEKRNEHIFKGNCITLTVRDDGMPRLNFKEVNWTDGFNYYLYALDVMDEVTKALRKFNRMKQEGLV